MRDTSGEILKFYKDEIALPGPDRTKMRERRDANRIRLKDGLEANKKPEPYGFWSQGSYAMHTMIQDADNDYDIDDGAYFYKEKLLGPNGGELSALQVRQMVCDGLGKDDRFSKDPEVLKNCVRVYYKSGFHVDLPSYRKFQVKDDWTGKVEDKYELASSDWRASDPKEVTKWFERQNKALSGDYDESEGQFLRVVKLLKGFARSRPSWKGQIATGFMITKIASDNFAWVVDRDDISLRSTMQRIVKWLDGRSEIDHPTLNNETITHANDGRPGFFRDRLIENLKHLEKLDQLDCKHSDAMSAWDSVFNTDWFSTQPEPDEGEKSFLTSAGPSSPVQKRGGGRYGKVA